MKLTEIEELANRIANLRSDEFNHDVSAMTEWLEPNAEHLAEATIKLVELVRVQSEALQFYADFINGKNVQPIFDDENSTRAQIYERYKEYSLGDLGLKAFETLDKAKQLGIEVE